MTKVCTGCGAEKALSEYPERKKGSGKYQSQCRSCYRKTISEWQKRNRDHRRAYVRAYNDSNRDRVRSLNTQAKRAWRENNRERDRLHVSSYQSRHPEVVVCWRKYKAAVRRGDVVPVAKCQKCGSEGPTEGHHTDYSRPYDVVWLCRPCHGAERRGVYEDNLGPYRRRR